MAVGWAFLLKSAAPGGLIDSDGLFEMAKAGIDVNLVLMALNLLPILPLDGGRIALSLLPGPLAYRYSRLEPYGFMVVIFLLVTGVLNHLMLPLLRAGEYAIGLLLGAG
jgi:Zn-dependent protease